MKPVAETHAMYQTANNHLRPRVLAFDAGHPFTSLLFREIVHGAERS